MGQFIDGTTHVLDGIFLREEAFCGDILGHSLACRMVIIFHTNNVIRKTTAEMLLWLPGRQGAATHRFISTSGA